MAAPNPCPFVPGDPALLMASGGYDTFMSLAPRTFQQALEYVDNLEEILIEPVQWTASFNFDGQLTPFHRPTKPTINAGDFAINLPPEPGEPPAFVPGDVLEAPAPTFTTPDPALMMVPPPARPNVSAPVAPRDDFTVTMPDAPDFRLPDLPTFEQLNLPPAPTLQLAEFEGVRPDFIEPPLNENWAWNPTPYTSDLRDRIVAKVEMMMDGGIGLEPIEALLFQRARSRIDIEVRRNIDTRTDEFTSRGFSEPNGILAQAVDEILQGGLDAKAELNTQIAVESYRELVQNVRFAVQQGLAAEQIATNLHIQEQQLALQAAQYLRDTSIAILNARVTVFNARLQAYQTDAQVMAERIRAELAKVEVFRAQIEGERARGEINEQRVRIYSEQVRSIGVMADLYRTQVETVKVEADIERARIERFRGLVDAYSARWRAYGEEVGAYKAQIEAENVKATVHKNLVDAFATKVTAWGTAEGNKIARERLRIDQSGQLIQVFRSRMDKMLALVEAEKARIAGVSQRADALARIYTAEAGVETAASAATDRSFQLGLEAENARVQTALRGAEIRIQENIQLTNMMIEVHKTTAQVLSQLAASAMSAMNFSASVSSSSSMSRACSSSVTWSGEAPDL